MTEEEKKAIEDLKEEIKSLEKAKIEFSNEIEDKSWLRKNINELDKDIFYKNTILNLIEKLQKENGELKEKKLIDRAMIEDSISKGIVERDYISKDKIREKIKELEIQAEEFKNLFKSSYAMKDEYLYTKVKIQGYKELLEEE